MTPKIPITRDISGPATSSYGSEMPPSLVGPGAQENADQREGNDVHSYPLQLHLQRRATKNQPEAGAAPLPSSSGSPQSPNTARICASHRFRSISVPDTTAFRSPGAINGATHVMRASQSASEISASPLKQVQTLHATCDRLIGRLSDALKRVSAVSLTNQHAAALSLVNSYQLKGLARQIHDYKTKLPAPNRAHTESTLHVRQTTIMNRGEFIDLASASLHQAKLVCDHFRHRVDALLFELAQCQHRFAGR